MEKQRERRKKRARRKRENREKEKLKKKVNVLRKDEEHKRGWRKRYNEGEGEEANN